MMHSSKPTPTMASGARCLGGGRRKWWVRGSSKERLTGHESQRVRERQEDARGEEPAQIGHEATFGWATPAAAGTDAPGATMPPGRRSAGEVRMPSKELRLSKIEDFKRQVSEQSSESLQGDFNRQISRQSSSNSNGPDTSKSKPVAARPGSRPRRNGTTWAGRRSSTYGVVSL